MAESISLKRLRKWIILAAGKYKLDPYLIAAFCKVESNYNTWAMKYEDHYRWLVDSPDPVSIEYHGQRTSWGLMQIMGAVARERGFKERYFSQICEASIGIDLGCRHLVWLRDKKGYKGDDMIAAYNAGSPRMIRMSGGQEQYKTPYVNQHYVDKIKDAQYRLIQTQIFSPNVGSISVA